MNINITDVLAANEVVRELRKETPVEMRKITFTQHEFENYMQAFTRYVAFTLDIVDSDVLECFDNFTTVEADELKVIKEEFSEVE